MPKADLRTLARYCDQLLRISAIQDYDGACNGLQVANRGVVSRLAAVVDATPATIRRAAEDGANLVVAHHGLFWHTRQPWTGHNHELIRLLIERDVAVYAAHLPLDIHPRLGNNARLCASLGFKKLKPFLLERGQHLGLRSDATLSRDELVERLRLATGDMPRVLAGGPAVCRRIGVVTGGAGSQVKTAAAEGVDTFVTGEGPHWTHALAEELGINVLYGGHYATETFGVKALAEHLSKRFRLPWSFVDHPTGL